MKQVKITCPDGSVRAFPSIPKAAEYLGVKPGGVKEQLKRKSGCFEKKVIYKIEEV